MNFIYSIFISFLIVISFWSLALFQSNLAQAFELKNEVEQEPKVIEVSKQVESKPIKLAGIKQSIQLAEIKTLWEKFNQATELHNNLKYPPKKVYVVYQGLANNYQEAEVIIGYDTDVVSNFENVFSIDISEQETLLPKKQYKETELAQAWKDINYSKNIQHVFEVHHLDLADKTTATQLFVSYQ